MVVALQVAALEGGDHYRPQPGPEASRRLLRRKMVKIVKRQSRVTDTGCRAGAARAALGLGSMGGLAGSGAGGWSRARP